MGISGVVDSSGGAVGLNKAVFTLNSVAFALFWLLFYISGVSVMNSVIKIVVSRCLEVKDNYILLWSCQIFLKLRLKVSDVKFEYFNYQSAEGSQLSSLLNSWIFMNGQIIKKC